MKFFIAIITIFSLALVSCKKEEEPKTVVPTPDPVVYDEFSFKLDGTQFYPADQVTTSTDTTIIHQGLNGAMVSRLTLSRELIAGSYYMNESQSVKIELSDDSFATKYTSTEGYLTILSHDLANKHIYGYFTCDLNKVGTPGTRTMTDGEFNLHY